MASGTALEWETWCHAGLPSASGSGHTSGTASPWLLLIAPGDGGGVGLSEAAPSVGLVWEGSCGIRAAHLGVPWPCRVRGQSQNKPAALIFIPVCLDKPTQTGLTPREQKLVGTWPWADMTLILSLTTTGRKADRKGWVSLD